MATQIFSISPYRLTNEQLKSNGYKLTDLTGKGYDVQFYNLDNAPLSEHGLRLNGVNGYGQVVKPVSGINAVGNQVTINIWFNLLDVPKDGKEYYLMSDEEGDLYLGALVWWDAVGNTFKFKATCGYGSIIWNGGNPTSAYAIYQMCVSFDFIAKTINYNGWTATNIYFSSTWYDALRTTSRKIHIGRRSNFSTKEKYFPGRIYKAEIYNGYFVSSTDRAIFNMSSPYTVKSGSIPFNLINLDAYEGKAKVPGDNEINFVARATLIGTGTNNFPRTVDLYWRGQNVSGTIQYSYGISINTLPYDDYTISFTDISMYRYNYVSPSKTSYVANLGDNPEQPFVVGVTTVRLRTGATYIYQYYRELTTEPFINLLRLEGGIQRAVQLDGAITKEIALQGGIVRKIKLDGGIQ